MKQLIKILLMSAFLMTTAFGKKSNFNRNDLFIKKHNSLIGVTKGTVIITHGILEHSGRYKHFIELLNKQGYDVYRYDLRGHGKSLGKRGHIKVFNQYILDLKSIVEMVKEKEGEIPIFLFGHSMGGLITFLYSKIHLKEDDTIKAVILSSPALNIPLTSSKKIKLFLAKILRNIIPLSYAKEDINRDLLTNDKTMKKSHFDDKNILSDFTISLGVELNNASKKARDMIKKNKTFPRPLFFIQGEKDQVTDAKLNIESAKSLTENNILVIENGLHELLNSKEVIRNFIMHEIVNFMDLHY